MTEDDPNPGKCEKCQHKGQIFWSHAAQAWTCLQCHAEAQTRG